MKTGGHLIVEALEAQGVETVFCIPGESYLAVLDALHDSPIRTVVGRQESGVAMMAEAQAKLTGRPAVCLVTRGPGAMNAAAGIHIAQQDSSPLVVLVGQIARGMRGRDAFQEVDFVQMFGRMAKWVADIDSPARIPEMIARAFTVAAAGRPGPVVLALPEDMLRETAAPGITAVPALPPPVPSPAAGDLAALAALLDGARAPMIIAGGARWTADAVTALRSFAERQAIPVVCSFRRQMLFDHDHPLYAGDLGLGVNPSLIARLKASDLVLLIGGRLSEVPSQGYTLFGIPEPGTTLVHVHPDALELGRVYRPALGINAAPGAFLHAALDAIPAVARPWRAHALEPHAEYDAWSTPADPRPQPLDPAAVLRYAAETLPDDAIIANGAGNFATWVHRYVRFHRFATQLAPCSGSMGYGVPAAIGAKLLHPEREVLAVTGDGDFQMTMQEFATAVQEKAAIVVLLFDNGMYGTIRMHQERSYPGRVHATRLINPDFAALARACGGHGETVACSEDFPRAFRRARRAGVPALICLRLDPEVLTPTRTLSQISAGISS